MYVLGTPSRIDVARGSTSVQAPDGSKKNKHTRIIGSCQYQNRTYFSLTVYWDITVL